MPMTPLEASTTLLFHAETDFRSMGARRTEGIQGYTFASVALSSAQAKFGSQSLDLMNANFGNLRFPRCGPISQDVPFSMDCWAYYRTHRNNSNFITLMQGIGGSGTRYFRVRTNSAGFPILEYRDDTNNDNPIQGPAALPLNQWVHIAASYNPLARTRRLYVNGVMVAAANGTVSTLGADHAADVRLGCYTTGGDYPADALVDEARHVFGHPVYEQNIDVPDSAFSDGVTGDSLLLHGEGTNGGTTITDSSTNGLTPTQIGSSGNVTTSTSASRFGLASLRLGGTQAISYASNALFEAASRDWTVESFVNVEPGSDNNARCIWQLFGASIDFRVNVYINRATGLVAVYTVNGAGTGATRIQATVLRQGSWQHIALVKEGSALTLWVDGVAVGSAIASLPTGNLGMCLGTQNYSPLATEYFIGNLEEFRVKMDTAVYPLNFTPSTSAYADCPVPDQATRVAPFAVKSVGTFGAVTSKLMDGQRKLKDVLYGGTGRIKGYVSKDKRIPAGGAPLGRRVVLMHEQLRQVIRETWSNPATGYYEFPWIAKGYAYASIAFDHLHDNRAEIADNQTPEDMP